MMTLEQIDADLRQWDHKLRMASDNMLELTDSVGYQRLLGEGHWPKAELAGVTAQRAQPAVEGLRSLWNYYLLLRDTIARAAEKRKSVSVLLPSRALLAEIEEMLHGPSIKLPAVATPLEQRGLLTAAETTQAVSPERLLTAMKQLFDEGRDVVMAIGAAWDQLPQKLTDIEAELDRLAAADDGAAGDIAPLRQRLQPLRQQLDADPLGAACGSDALAAEIEAMRTRMEQSADQRRSLSDDLAAARQTLAAMGQTHGEVRETLDQCRIKVRSDCPSPLPCPAEDATVAALEAWLDRLEAEVAAGRWRPVRVGIQHWNAAARQCLAADAQARSAAETLLNRRRDLRGLLGALRAKAAANGRAEDPALADIHDKASQLLATRPTPLEALQRLVAQYQQRLL